MEYRIILIQILAPKSPKGDLHLYYFLAPLQGGWGVKTRRDLRLNSFLDTNIAGIFLKMVYCTN
jgi:hypothetical protein